MAWKLIALNGADQGVEVMVDRDQLIGRSPYADIVLPSNQVELEHARLVIKHDQLWLEDLESFSGTWVNQERIANLALYEEDVLSFGEYHFRVTEFRSPYSTTLLDEAPQSSDQADMQVNYVGGDEHELNQSLSIGRSVQANTVLPELWDDDIAQQQVEHGQAHSPDHPASHQKSSQFAFEDATPSTSPEPSYQSSFHEPVPRAFSGSNVGFDSYAQAKAYEVFARYGDEQFDEDGSDSFIAGRHSTHASDEKIEHRLHSQVDAQRSRAQSSRSIQPRVENTEQRPTSSVDLPQSKNTSLVSPLSRSKQDESVLKQASARTPTALQDFVRNQEELFKQISTQAKRKQSHGGLKRQSSDLSSQPIPSSQHSVQDQPEQQLKTPLTLPERQQLAKQNTMIGITFIVVMVLVAVIIGGLYVSELL